MCGKTPKPDPAMGRAAEASAQIGREQFEFGKQQWEYEKAQWEKLAPMYEEMMKGEVADSQRARERGDVMWDDWTNIYRPIEAKSAAEAMNYDSAEESARREGLAGATVQAQIDAQRGDVTREIGRMGGSAARAGQQLTSDSNELALAKAGAVNQERTNTKLTGMALRQQAVATGRGLPSMGMGYGQASNADVGMATGVAGAGQGFRAAGSNNYFRGAQGALAGYGTSGSIYGSMYDASMRGYESKMGTIGSVVGAVGTLGGAWLGRK